MKVSKVIVMTLWIVIWLTHSTDDVYDGAYTAFVIKYTKHL